MNNHPSGTALPIVIIVVAVVFAGAIAAIVVVQKTFSEPAPVFNTPTNAESNANAPANANANIAVNTNTTANTNATVNTNTTADPTADWKTYTNTDYSYSLKYPQEYAVSGPQEHARFQKGRLAGDPTHSVSVRAFTESNFAKFTEEEREWYGWAKQDFPKASEGIFTQRRSVQWGGNTFTAFDFDPASSTGYKVVYFLRQGGTTFMLWDDRQGEREVETNERIIATFTITSPTADWKTYTNTNVGYSFRHPPEYSAIAQSSDEATYLADTNGKTKVGVHFRPAPVGFADPLATWFDREPVGTGTLGGRAGKRFIYQVCEMGSCGDKTVAIIGQHTGKVLGLEFYGDETLDATEEQILSTFQFTE